MGRPTTPGDVDQATVTDQRFHLLVAQRRDAGRQRGCRAGSDKADRLLRNALAIHQSAQMGDDCQQAIDQVRQVAFGVGIVALAFEQQVDGQCAKACLMQLLVGITGGSERSAATAGNKNDQPPAVSGQYQIALQCRVHQNEVEASMLQCHATPKRTGMRCAPKALSKVPKHPAMACPQAGQCPSVVIS